MPNPAINVTVTTEVGFCPFCGRTRTLRREERHLGGLVRTTIDCESCHRTLSSTIGPPSAPEPEAAEEPATAPEVQAEAPEKPAKPARARKAPVTNAAAPKTARKAPTAKSTAKKN
jgi:hypothetical protein